MKPKYSVRDDAFSSRCRSSTSPRMRLNAVLHSSDVVGSVVTSADSIGAWSSLSDLTRRQARTQIGFGVGHHLAERAGDLHRHRDHPQCDAATDARRDGQGVGGRRREQRGDAHARAHQLRGDGRAVAVGKAGPRGRGARQAGGRCVQRQLAQQRAAGVLHTHDAARLGGRRGRSHDVDLDQRRTIGHQHELGIAAGKHHRLREVDADDRVVALWRRRWPRRWRRRR